MKKVAMITLGCRVNQYETQAIREELFQLGFKEVPFDSESDVYLINTCAVTGESERKARQVIRRALRQKEKNPHAVVCVCGCFSQGAGEDSVFLGVDVVAGNTGKSKLAAILANLIETPIENRKKIDLRCDIAKVTEYEPLSVCRSHNARAFVKIQDGCNSFCSYCFVPFVRGRVRSRSMDEIVAEVYRLAENGYREIVLTGIETGAYGQDFSEKDGLCTLVEKLQKIPGIERIRFGSLKPSLFTESFCSRLSSFSKVMPHFHLSLQSGSARVLKAMGRNYTRFDELQAVENIKRYFPDAGLSADLICGFPGEKTQDFSDTVSLVEQVGLLHTHIFPFSPRAGTRAATMPDPVDGNEKKQRAAILLEKAKEMSCRFGEERAGKTYRVLCERICDGYAFGYTENFIYTKTPAPDCLQVGEVFSVELTNEKRFIVETMTVIGKSVKEG